MLPEKLEQIKKEFDLLGILNDEARFECYDSGDSIACYSITNKSIYHEINVICDNTSYFRDMKIIDILNLKDIDYLDHAIYEDKTKGFMHRETYAPLKETV
jgi:hypothetical protein